MDTDRNLLFGILALQNDFITRDQLVEAINAWVLAKQRPLGELLPSPVHGASRAAVIGPPFTAVYGGLANGLMRQPRFTGFPIQAWGAGLLDHWATTGLKPRNQPRERGCCGVE